MKREIRTLAILGLSTIIASGPSVADEANGLAQLTSATIEYFSEGNGPAVVMLSGRGLDVGYLSSLSHELSVSGYRAIRINRRGAGKSTGNLDDLDYHIHADDVAGVLTALGVEKASLFGHALGNRVAQAFADGHPDMTTSVILSPAAGPVQGDPADDAVTNKMFAPKASDEDIAAGMELMVGDPANSEWIWDIVSASKITDPATLRAETTVNEPLEDWWAKPGKAPYLILQGLKDRQSPPENARLMRERLGDRATVVEFPEAGHLFVIESADKAASAIRAFLNALE